MKIGSNIILCGHCGDELVHPISPMFLERDTVGTNEITTYIWIQCAVCGLKSKEKLLNEDTI